MITESTLRNPALRRKIMQATAHVIKHDWCVEHIKNTQGVPVLAIRVRDGKAILTDRHHRDVTEAFKRGFN